MKMTDLLEKDKNNLLTELSNAANAEKAVKVLENETDKLLLRYNEQCSSEAVRETAAYMMQAVRLALPLIDSSGKTKVWEHEQKKESAGKSIPGILLLILGIGLAAYAMIPLIMAGLSASDAVTHRELATRLLSMLAAVCVSYAGGTLMNRAPGKGKKEHHVEIRVDADKLYRYFRTVMLSVDQSLDEVSARERWDKREQAGNIDGRPATTPELDLFSDLLAAAYSGDPEYALEKIDSIKYYLHKQQIEVVDYSESTRQYFDLMPGSGAGTIRPAMIADGTLLKKGLASTGR